MQTALYAKVPVPAQTDLSTTRLLTDEAFQLSPEQLVEINRRWSTHMIRQNMSCHCSRVLQAIYRHTIEFQKWQDDMSGKRLQQITYIRYDHANKAIRLLEAGNAIISRDGHYGKWLSINFDFDSWQKTDAKSLKRRTNNPHILLPDYCRNQPVDAPPAFAESEAFIAEMDEKSTLDSTSEEQEGFQPLNDCENVEQPDSGYTIDNNNIKKTTTTKTRENSKIEDEAQNGSHILLQQMLKQLANLEQKLNQQLDTQNRLDERIHSTLEEKFNQQQLDTQSCLDEHIHATVEAQLTKKLKSQAEATQKAQEHRQQPKEAKSEKLKEPSLTTSVSTNKSQSVVVVSSKNKVNKALALRYPNSMDKLTQQGLGDLLIKAGDQAQNLLDLLALRLQNTQNPVNNIPIYFSSLVRRLHNDELDLSNLKAHTASQKPAPTASEKAMQTLQAEYQEANADYVHFKRIYTQQAKNEQCSLQDYVKKSPICGLWQGLNQRLESAKSAIHHVQL